MKTFNDCLNDVSRGHFKPDGSNFTSFNDLLAYFRSYDMTKLEITLIIDEAATLFAEQDKWVSVEDGLPEDFEDVLIWQYDIAVLAYRHAGSWTVKWQYYTTNDVTHWQPLPAAPKV